ncbi:hypothetical protein I4U23_004675 [Adineta vaga]|nr:hypothetical protein I4U23_004675 [Adineta vaga]
MTLIEVTAYVNIYGFFTVIILGTVESTLNRITFLSNDFRTKACIFYLVCASLLDLIRIDFGIIIRLITEYFGSNLTVTSRVVSKIRAYVLVCFNWAQCGLLSVFSSLLPCFCI